MRTHPICTPLLLLLALASPAFASDGVREINQTCAVQTGCFPGDAAGFPVTITAPGSYRLTSNLTIPDANTSGITLSANDVGIDLNDFALIGPVVCSGTPLTCTPNSGSGSGIDFSSPSVRGTSIHDGSVTGMGNTGIAVSEQSTVTHVRARWNRNYGIYASYGSTISNSLAFQNGLIGIFAERSATVSGNSAYQNGATGIFADHGSTLSNNSAYLNGNVGIGTGTGSTISGNAAYDNGNDGISAGDGSTILGNSSNSNGDATSPSSDDGISCGWGCIVRENATRSNSGYGLTVGLDTAYSDNVVTGNTTGQVRGAGSANGRGGNYCAGTGTVSSNCP